MNLSLSSLFPPLVSLDLNPMQPETKVAVDRESSKRRPLVQTWKAEKECPDSYMAGNWDPEMPKTMKKGNSSLKSEELWSLKSRTNPSCSLSLYLCFPVGWPMTWVRSQKVCRRVESRKPQFSGQRTKIGAQGNYKILGRPRRGWRLVKTSS